MSQLNGLNGMSSNDAANIDASTIIEALNLIHNPLTHNDRRLEAMQLLERVKERNDLADIGFSLGSDTERPPLVRHYGLSLLEHVIRHKWHHLNEGQSEHFRNMILNLSQNLDQTPQPFIRNKISQLWLEIIKRSWALDWYDLDEYLVQLWLRGATCKEFTLSVLENLSADVFERDDSTAVLRGQDFRNAVVEIFSSRATYAGGIKIGENVQQVRHGDEGWLARITTFVNECLQNNTIETSSKSTAMAALSTLRSVFTWSTTPPLINAQCLPTVCACLQREDSDLILSALEILNSLYGRSKMEEVEVQALVYPLCQPENVSTLDQVYSWSIVNIDEIDSPKYTICKKMAELISSLADWMAHFAPPADIDCLAILQLIVKVAQHESLIISIAAAHCWEAVLQSSRWRKTDAVKSCAQSVLSFAAGRVIAYDQIPEEVQDPGVLFVNDEIELHPDRQAFFITYRRLCMSIIEWITYTFLNDVLDYLLMQVDQALDQITQSEASFDPSSYTRSSLQLLKIDAQFTIVEAAFRGIVRWTYTHEAQKKEESKQLKERIKAWSEDLLSRRILKDPLMKQRLIKHAVETSSRSLTADTGFAMKVLQYLLSSFTPLQPQYPAYSDALGECHAYASVELRRLALEHASYFVTFYDQLENNFMELTASGNIDEKVQIDLKSTLFLVVQRAEGVDPNLRKSRLQTFLEPLATSWSQNRDIFSSFESFVQSQAFDQVGPYMASTGASRHADWSDVTFGEDGAKVQQAMIAGASKVPLRETRVLLSVSTDRLSPESETYNMICELWVPMLPLFLESILRCINYNHRLHDSSAWPNVSDDQKLVILRIMRDRYWQAGISEGSMVEFHRKVKSTKTTMEGFASSVRGRIRTNLENCYSIIHTLGRLGSHFYSMQNIPETLSSELLQTAHTLSLHHFGTLLSMLPKLVEECPPANRQHFLTPVLSTMLQVMDAKCTSEWQKLEARKEGTRQDDNLNDEMREESVLRQMTYRAVNMVSFWLNSNRELMLSNSARIVNGPGPTPAEAPFERSMRDFILSNVRVVEPLLVFCTHSIAFKDTRACATMASALQRLVPVFATENHLHGQEAAAVREFISTEMLRTLITSLHDGYFADYQNHLATVIAMIWTAYGLPAHIPANELAPAHDRPALTSAPRDLLLQLPNMTPDKVDAAGAQLASEGVSGKHRKLRAIVLQLLEDVRGVRLSELGKIDTKAAYSRIMEKYKARQAMNMNTNMGGEGSGSRGDDRGGVGQVDLGGIADMFGQ